MPPLTPRLKSRIRADFGPGADAVISLLTRYPSRLGLDPRYDHERLQAAVVLIARGDIGELSGALELGMVDWRDLLVSAGLGNEDWPSMLARELGDATFS